MTKRKVTLATLHTRPLVAGGLKLGIGCVMIQTIHRA
jgi:hypothetical protein